MDLFEYIHLEMARMRRQVTSVMKDITPQEFNWPPPGTANTISATFLHLTSVEDNIVQGLLQGKPRVWDTGGWSERTRVQKPPSTGESWDEFKHATLALGPFFEYQQAVWAATDAYLPALTAGELDRKVMFHGTERTVADMLILVASQAAGHAGEIAALKGIQGARGLPV